MYWSCPAAPVVDALDAETAPPDLQREGFASWTKHPGRLSDTLRGPVVWDGAGRRTIREAGSRRWRVG